MMRKQDYPPEWPAISLAIRARAKQQCEFCGAPNGQWILRDARPTQWQYFALGEDGKPKGVPYMDFQVYFPQNLTREYYKKEGAVKIILTVAHLDRDRTNNDPSNLAALCQRCHLNHDRQAQHIPHRKYGRYHDREQQGKLDV